MDKKILTNVPKKYLLHPDSLRLSHKGFAKYKSEYQYFCYNLKSLLTTRRLILISRNVTFPYYFSLTGTTIAIFSPETAFLLKLNGNNFDLWLDSFE